MRDPVRRELGDKYKENIKSSYWREVDDFTYQSDRAIHQKFDGSGPRFPPKIKPREEGQPKLKQGTRALIEIRRAQRFIGLMMPKVPFVR